MKLKMKYRKKLETLEEIALLSIYAYMFGRVFLFVMGIDLWMY